MSLPGDGAMMVLLALWVGEGLSADGGTLLLSLPDGTRRPVPDSVLDTLESLGYVEITEYGAVATDRAGYALNKWVTSKARARGERGNYVLTGATIRRAA